LLGNSDFINSTTTSINLNGTQQTAFGESIFKIDSSKLVESETINSSMIGSSKQLRIDTEDL
jgi:hypothetical protein